MSRRVLLVDDEPDIREVAKVGLEVIGGWEVLTAANGLEGLAVAASERVDAILLVVMMPGLDGVEVIGRLRSDPTTSTTPVVFLTAKVQAADRRHLADLGADGILAKPFDPLTLAGEVAGALGWAP